jgi:serine O-acetyltransferase
MPDDEIALRLELAGSTVRSSDKVSRKPSSNQSMWGEILADLRIKNTGGHFFLRLLANRGFHSLFCYRIAHKVAGTPLSFIGIILTRLCQIFYGIDIDPKATIAGGVVIYHGMGLVIGRGVVIESNVTLFHGVTLGIKWSGRGGGYPHVESGVIIGTGAVLLGPIRIGANSIIGANTVITHDIPPSSMVRVAPYKITPMNPPGQ